MLGAKINSADAAIKAGQTPPLPSAPLKGVPFHVMVRKSGSIVKALIVVTANYDPDTKLWSAASAELGGLFLRETSWKALVAAVPGEIDKHLPPRLFRPRRDIAIEVGGIGAAAKPHVESAPSRPTAKIERSPRSMFMLGLA